MITPVALAADASEVAMSANIEAYGTLCRDTVIAGLQGGRPAACFGRCTPRSCA